MNEQDTGTGTIDRRRVLAGALSVGVATALGVTVGMAQEGTPTVESETSGTPETGETETTTDTATTDDWAEVLQEVDDVLASVQADRDAIAVSADVSLVDQLVTQATGLRDRAQTAADGADDVLTRRLTRAAVATARAARDLIEAQQAAYGLPSQQARTSRTLADAYETVSSVGTEVASSTDADVGAVVATAQQLYQAAYDLYGAGTYAQAVGTARVAAKMARVGSLLAGSADDSMIFDRPGRDNERGSDGSDRDRGRSNDGRDAIPPDSGDVDPDANDEPVEVPAPTF